MKRVIILSSQEDYWEACYVDGKSVQQAHHLGDGLGKLGFLKEVCRDYDVTLEDIQELDAEEIDDEDAMECGAFPDLFENLKGDYS